MSLSIQILYPTVLKMSIHFLTNVHILKQMVINTFGERQENQYYVTVHKYHGVKRKFLLFASPVNWFRI
jgi:hypothetical protein